LGRPLKDILKGMHDSRIKSASLGKDPAVDYAPKPVDDRKFVAKHAVQHHDWTGRPEDDAIFNGSNVQRKPNRWTNRGYDRPEDEEVNGIQGSESGVADAEKNTNTMRTGAETDTAAHEKWNAELAKQLGLFPDNTGGDGASGAIKESEADPPCVKSIQPKFSRAFKAGERTINKDARKPIKVSTTEETEPRAIDKIWKWLA